MYRRYVNSSNLLGIGYQPYTGTLEIAFHNGHVYHYYHVPAPIYNALMHAPSHGQFFNYFIRNQFPYRQIQ